MNVNISFIQFSFPGQQFIPSTFYYFDKNGNLRIDIDPNSQLNHEYAATFWRGSIHYWDTERKIILALETGNH